MIEVGAGNRCDVREERVKLGAESAGKSFDSGKGAKGVKLDTHTP